MESDKDDESERILALYSMVNERDRALLEYFLVGLMWVDIKFAHGEEHGKRTGH